MILADFLLLGSGSLKRIRIRLTKINGSKRIRNTGDRELYTPRFTSSSLLLTSFLFLAPSVSFCFTSWSRHRKGQARFTGQHRRGVSLPKLQYFCPSAFIKNDIPPPPAPLNYIKKTHFHPTPIFFLNESSYYIREVKKGRVYRIRRPNRE